MKIHLYMVILTHLEVLDVAQPKPQERRLVSEHRIQAASKGKCPGDGVSLLRM